LTRLARPKVRRVEGWVGGVNENAPPVADPEGGAGTLDQAQNFFPTGVGKLAVRGGSQVKRTLNCNRALYLRPFTPTGAIAVAHTDGTGLNGTKHYIWRLTADLAFFAATELLSETDLVWNVATPARPIGAELFEKMFLADATVDYSARQGLVCLTGAGVVTPVSFDLGGGAQQLKPYVVEEFNNHLFVAGYENMTLSADAPATLRHSYLGISPEAAGGFDPLAYNYIGAKGQRITGLKKGRGLMLVAKANELYRVTGFGIAKPGWTFAVEMVQNTQGLGVSNPYALTYAGGYWYGIGEGGPFRSDGFGAEFLGLPRERSWGKTTNLSYAWAIYHPDRNVVLFGLNQTPVPSGRSATYPTVVWIWDCQREEWMGDVAMSADMMYAHAIPTGTVLGPTALPNTLAFTHASATTSSVAATWANGDATAATELWLRDETHGGSYYLWATAAAAATTATLSSLTSGSNYKAKIRHIKAGVASDWTAEVDAYTALPAPGLTGEDLGFGMKVLSASVPIAHGQVLTERNAGLVDTQTVTVIGTYIYRDSTTDVHDYRSRLYDVAWPAAIQYSAYSDTATL